VFCCLVYGVLGILWLAVGDFLTFRWQCLSPKRRDIQQLHSSEIHKKYQRSYFAAVLLTIANLHTILHAHLFRAVCMNVYQSDRGLERISLALILLNWRVWWAPNDASKWQMGFNSVFNGLIWKNRYCLHFTSVSYN